MTPVSRASPNIDPDIAPFWDGLRQREFRLFRCLECGAWYWPVAFCRTCPPEPFYANMRWTPSSGRGRVFAFTVHRRSSNKAFTEAVPYVVALIELDEGPMFGCNVVACAPDDVWIGLPVRVRYESVDLANGTPFTIALFEPDTERGEP